MGLDIQPDWLTAGHCQPDKNSITSEDDESSKKSDVFLLQEKELHIFSTDVVKVDSSVSKSVSSN